ncbi:double homeobox protein B, partial [Trichechus inunguis]
INILHRPFLFSSSSTLQRKVQERTAYSERQKNILQVWFEHNPHPNEATREQLAKEIGVPEYKIEVGSKFLFHCLSDSSWVYVSQASAILTVQPTQAVQGGENSDSPVTLMNHLPVQLTLGGALSNTLFWTQPQEKFQDHKEHTGTEALQLKDFSQTDPKHKRQELQHLGQHDVSYIMQWWEEGCQALTAEWEPPRGTLQQPGYTETDLQQQKAQLAEEPSPPPDQLHQQ